MKLIEESLNGKVRNGLELTLRIRLLQVGQVIRSILHPQEPDEYAVMTQLVMMNLI